MSHGPPSTRPAVKIAPTISVASRSPTGRVSAPTARSAPHTISMAATKTTMIPGTGKPQRAKLAVNVPNAISWKMPAATKQRPSSVRRTARAMVTSVLFLASNAASRARCLACAF